MGVVPTASTITGAAVSVVWFWTPADDDRELLNGVAQTVASKHDSDNVLHLWPDADRPHPPGCGCVSRRTVSLPH